MFAWRGPGGRKRCLNSPRPTSGAGATNPPQQLPAVGRKTSHVAPGPRTRKSPPTKRAIDGYNQARNDATERVDEFLLMSLGLIDPATAGGDQPVARVSARTRA